MIIPIAVEPLKDARMEGVVSGSLVYAGTVPVQLPVPEERLSALLPEIALPAGPVARDPPGPTAARRAHSAASQAPPLQAAPELRGKHSDPYAPPLKQFQQEEVREHGGGRLRMRLAARTALPTQEKMFNDSVIELRRMIEVWKREGLFIVSEFTRLCTERPTTALPALPAPRMHSYSRLSVQPLNEQSHVNRLPGHYNNRWRQLLAARSRHTRVRSRTAISAATHSLSPRPHSTPWTSSWNIYEWRIPMNTPTGSSSARSSRSHETRLHLSHRRRVLQRPRSRSSGKSGRTGALKQQQLIVEVVCRRKCGRGAVVSAVRARSSPASQSCKQAA